VKLFDRNSKATLVFEPSKDPPSFAVQGLEEARPG